MGHVLKRDCKAARAEDSGGQLALPMHGALHALVLALWELQLPSGHIDLLWRGLSHGLRCIKKWLLVAGRPPTLSPPPAPPPAPPSLPPAPPSPPLVPAGPPKLESPLYSRSDCHLGVCIAVSHTFSSSPRSAEQHFALFGCLFTTTFLPRPRLLGC